MRVSPMPSTRSTSNPRYREAFDEDLVQRAALRAPMNAQVEELEFVKDWYDENEEGLRGGMGCGSSRC